ncbi:DUF481 domain-containing protein [Paraflavitalea pollutisoli]|uniref:DUF481 domain-containing protein n=1 Tax=Paraflavitalea pollutisoli TaxID=3034143 RepID=UPI0023EDDC82|nr:DUF481 domain-containing protein [Paraflavitalea sp. H1-2-19X]
MLWVICFVLFVLRISVVQCQVRDSLFLYNGQVLIGEIQSISLGEVSIDDIDLKMMNVKLYKIRVLKSSRRFKFELDDKELFYGTMVGGVKDGWVDIHADNGNTIPVTMEQLHVVIPLEKQFFKSLHGNLSTGFSYTKSSGVGQVNLSSSVVYAASKFEYQLTASANYSIDSASFSRDREDLSLMAGYSVTPTWFISATASYQRNLELSIARRFQESVGAGNKLVVRKRWQLYGISGISFNQELSTAGESEGMLLEVPVMFRFNYFKFHHPNIQISSTQSAYLGLTQFGRFRMEGNTSFSWQVIRYFYITLNPYTNFDSQPPAGGNKYDYGVVLSVTYKF